MAQQQFRFGTFCLMRDAILSKKAYGHVYKATLDELPCAAKRLHPILAGPRANNPWIHMRFEQECRFLSEIRHPNIVQYLGVAQDEETGLPVLLMELMDDSLTHFLEQSEEPLAYHVQVNISHDIALAVAFLHLNRIVHRNLSSNSVLLIGADSRAKVAEFMLAAPVMTDLTKCPGVPAYMAPEAMFDPPVYTEKLDCFQVGVLMIQTITRKFPDPGPAMKRVRNARHPTGWINAPVPEVERRQNHLSSISPTHPMLRIAMDCMKDKDSERPSAHQICQTLSALKEAPEYGQSLEGRGGERDGDVQEREELIQQLRQENQEREREVREKEGDIERLQSQLQEEEGEVREREREVREKEGDIERLQSQLQEKEGEVREREREVREREKEVRDVRRQNRTLQNEVSEREREIRMKEGESREKKREVTLNVRDIQRLERVVQENNITIHQLQQTQQQMRHDMERMRQTHAAEQDRWRQDMANMQQRLDDAQAQLEKKSTKPDIAPWKVSRSDVKVVQEIGIGAWGTVARGEYCGQKVAVKLPHRYILSQHTLQRLERETLLMTQVRHPNLIRIIAAVFDDESRTLRSSPMIVTELLDINLRQCYEQGRLQGSSRMSIFRDVAYGLHYLHDRQEPIIHRDVSAPNVLLQALPAGMWRAKVSDFGSANLARLSKTAGEGAIIYTAPEAFPQIDPSVPRIPHSTKIDIFSYGILLCEVITARLPDPEQFSERLEQVRVQSVPFHGLIVSCTKRNPDNRPTIAQVIDELYKIPQPRPRRL